MYQICKVLVLDVIFDFGKFINFGIGYSFAGRSEDKITCGSENRKESKNGMYGFAGNVLQYGYGVGPLAGTNGTAKQQKQACHTYMAGPDGGLQYYYLGKTDKVSFVSPQQNAAYTYGVPLNAILAKFDLPEIDNNVSGLINAQVINRIFSHIDFVKETEGRSWYGNFLVAYDFGVTNYPTALFTTIAFKMGCSF